MLQSREDQTGHSHTHGWGVATYPDHVPHVERQAWAAYHGEHFRRAAARTYSRTVLAHVRRASIGSVKLENTHPFTHKQWVFAHNGTLRAFDKMRQQMLDAMTPEHRMGIQGSTDSEHIFHFLLSLHDRCPHRTPLDTLRAGLLQVIDWSRQVDPEAGIGLNVLLTNGEALVGSRWGRTLWYVERDRVQDCEICGFPHIHHDPHVNYRAAVIASEPISHEHWIEAPEHSIFSVMPDMRLHFESLA